MERIDLHFPKFTDGRAFSQAFLLRRRLGFTGDIRATGDVLIDQLVQMERTGFSSAVLRADQDVADAQRQFDRYAAFYQGDAVHAQPLFTGAGMKWAPSTCTRAPSRDFDAKLAETQGAAASAPLPTSRRITQASSLGAEDVVITHLINSLELDIPVFVLETGMLHQQTLDLLERTRATSRAPVNVYRPVNEAVIQFVAREGKEPMYKSIDLRKACCHIRKVEPLERALAGKRAWITGLRREQSQCPRRSAADRHAATTPRPRSSSTRWPTGPGATSGTTSASTRSTTTRCTTSSIPASAARPAPAPSAWARISAPAAGGGKTRPPRNAACT